MPFLQGALVILVRTTDFANFGLSESEYKYCASLMPLSLDVPNLSHEKCVRLQALLFLRDFVNS